MSFHLSNNFNHRSLAILLHYTPSFVSVCTHHQRIKSTLAHSVFPLYLASIFLSPLSTQLQKKRCIAATGVQFASGALEKTYPYLFSRENLAVHNPAIFGGTGKFAHSIVAHAYQIFAGFVVVVGVAARLPLSWRAGLLTHGAVAVSRQ
ncbi:hypothetical protein ACS0PU_011673 [Formica fusca]